MGKKLFLSDLDGTLLDNPVCLSSQYSNQLNTLIQTGLNFSIATGRDIEKAKQAIPDLNITLPVILTNGALLADFQTEQYIKVTHIKPEIVQLVMNLSQKYQIAPIVFASFDKVSQNMFFHKGKWGKKGIHFLPPEMILPYLNFDVVSIQFHTDRASLEPFYKELLETCSTDMNLIYIEDVSYSQFGIPGEWYWLEINSHEAGKEKMLRYLSDILHISLKDIVVFGDNYNDIEILRIAGKGIVVDNAPDEVKQIADEIIASNLEGGVINYLLKHQDDF